MGLNERRKIKELEDVTLPNRTKEIAEICGKPVSYQVDWATFDTLEALNFMDNISCHRLNMALRAMCLDDFGKQTVRDGLKLVKLANAKDKASMKMDFSDGTLEMHCAYALHTEGMYSDDQINQFLSDHL